MPETLSKNIRKKRFTAMLDKYAGGTIALFFAYIVAASSGNTPESIEALFTSTTSIFILLFYKIMLSYDSVEKPEKESAYFSIMYLAALVTPLITFMLILHSISSVLLVFTFVIFLICLAFLIAFLLHGYKREKNVAERVSTPNESNKKIAKRVDKKFFPYILFAVGLLYGLGFAIDWNIQVGGLWDVSFKTQLETEKSAWDIVAAIGSILAGVGTICLFVFGLLKANEWKKQMLLKDKREALFGWYLEAHAYADNVKSELASSLSKFRFYARSNEKSLNELHEAKRTRVDNVDKLYKQQKELDSYTRSLMADCVRAQNTLSKMREKVNRRGKLLFANFPDKHSLACQLNSSLDSLNETGESYFLRDFLKDPKLLTQNIDRMRADIDKVLEEMKFELQ